MSKTQATPGPWRREGTELVTIDDTLLRHAVIRDRNERWVALVEAEDAEGEATVHLIAAAPQMREALQAIVNATAQGRIYSDDAVMNEARAALRAANGEPEGDNG